MKNAAAPISQPRAALPAPVSVGFDRQLFRAAQLVLDPAEAPGDFFRREGRDLRRKGTVSEPNPLLKQVSQRRRVPRGTAPGRQDGRVAQSS